MLDSSIDCQQLGETLQEWLAQNWCENLAEEMVLVPVKSLLLDLF